MTLIWKLLKQHISIAELSAFFVANLIGVTVILSGVQLYSDVKPLLSGERELIGSDYVIISHPVERFGEKPKHFTAAEIADIRNQEFVGDVGLFASSQYEVYGSIIFGGQRLSTMMFFEAVADNFVDVKSSDWYFEQGDRVIPIIIPRNYLNLYNFGFSQTQSLPQITEDMIKRVELTVELSGNGLTEEYKGRIVGFSDRLNTILVPMSFMEWADQRYADGIGDNSSRLILEVDNPSAPELTTYLAERGYVTEEQPAESSKAMFLLKVAIAIIVAIGVIFCLLSIIILTLSIYLLLQKNIDKLENLVLIGYTPAQVAMPYNRLAIVLNLIVMTLGIMATLVAQKIYMSQLEMIAGIELPYNPLASIITGVVVATLTSAFNIYIIGRKIGEISRKR